jgi:ABC-type antimicrobial peptide transport system permease subunit
MSKTDDLGREVEARILFVATVEIGVATLDEVVGIVMIDEIEVGIRSGLQDEIVETATIDVVVTVETPLIGEDATVETP